MRAIICVTTAAGLPPRYYAVLEQEGEQAAIIGYDQPRLETEMEMRAHLHALGIAQEVIEVNPGGEDMPAEQALGLFLFRVVGYGPSDLELEAASAAAQVMRYLLEQPSLASRLSIETRRAVLAEMGGVPGSSL
jgi:hypothetical protein